MNGAVIRLTIILTCSYVELILHLLGNFDCNEGSQIVKASFPLFYMPFVMVSQDCKFCRHYHNCEQCLLEGYRQGGGLNTLSNGGAAVNIKEINNGTTQPGLLGNGLFHIDVS